MNDTEFERAWDAHLECALWASLAEGPDLESDPINADDLFGTEDIPADVLAEMRTDFESFVNDPDLAGDLEGMEPEQIGHDFWLTRNHHGAGFWDRGLGEAGTRLTDACRPYGELDLQLYYVLDESGEPVKPT